MVRRMALAYADTGIIPNGYAVRLLPGTVTLRSRERKGDWHMFRRFGGAWRRQRKAIGITKGTLRREHRDHLRPGRDALHRLQEHSTGGKGGLFEKMFHSIP